MNSSGWIKLHREIFDSDIWNDVTTFRLFIYLIGQASHVDEFKYRGMTLNKGQYVRSYRKLADDLSYKEGRGYKKYSLSTIKSCVNKLVKSERVNVNETELGTLFTIVNYAKYQHYNEQDERSQNGMNEEVRTNAELTPNEVRTNAEQYQELKNLRTKELKEFSSSNNDENFSEVMQFYQANLQRGISESPFNLELIQQFYDEFGSDLLLAAMKTSAKAEAKGIKFTEGVLKNWREAGVKTLEDARKHETEFKNNRSGNNIVNIKD